MHVTLSASGTALPPWQAAICSVLFGLLLGRAEVSYYPSVAEVFFVVHWQDPFFHLLLYHVADNINIDSLLLLPVSVYERGVAQYIDQARCPACVIIDSGTCLGVEQIGVASGCFKTMPDVLPGLFEAQRFQVESDGNALGKLMQLGKTKYLTQG